MRFAVLCLIACGPIASGTGGSTTKDTAPQATAIGESHEGDYSLGPVAFTGSFWNSCAPYTADLEKQTGTLLAGLALKWNGDGSLCDACVQIRTAKGKSVIAHVITTGETRGPNDLDLSQAAFDAINQGEYPRKMTWEIVKCANAGKLQYQFQTEANPYWTSLWVRNGKLPAKKVEVKKGSGGDWVSLTRGTDGTLTDASGFGEGAFQLRLTAIDGQVVTESFPKFTAGAVLTGAAQFE